MPLPLAVKGRYSSIKLRILVACLAYSPTLKMEVVRSTEMSVSHLREPHNQRSYNLFPFTVTGRMFLKQRILVDSLMNLS
jgi:hypothetical protein